MDEFRLTETSVVVVSSVVLAKVLATPFDRNGRPKFIRKISDHEWRVHLRRTYVSVSVVLDTCVVVWSTVVVTGVGTTYSRVRQYQVKSNIHLLKSHPSF